MSVSDAAAYLRDELRKDWEGYRDGDTGRATALSVVQIVLGVGLLARVVVHTNAYAVLCNADDPHPLDVDYGFVACHAVDADADQAHHCRLLTMGLALALALFYAPSVNLAAAPPAAVVFVVGNLGFLIGDPVIGGFLPDPT